MTSNVKTKSKKTVQIHEDFKNGTVGATVSAAAAGVAAGGVIGAVGGLPGAIVGGIIGGTAGAIAGLEGAEVKAADAKKQSAKK